VGQEVRPQADARFHHQLTTKGESVSSNPPYLRIYPPGHVFGNPSRWVWQVCSLNDIEMSGTSDEQTDAMDQATSALDDLMGVDQ
jgi:hypothetical protein